MVEDSHTGIEWLDERIYVLSLFLAGLGLRVFNLGERVLWQDEALHAFAAKAVLGGSLTGSYAIENVAIAGYPPLYHYMLSPSFIFSRLPSEFLLRLPSALFGALAIFVAYLLGSRLYNRQTALLAAIFIAFSSNLILYSRQAHPISLAILTSVLSVYFFYRFLEDSATRNLLLFTAFTALALLSHFVNYALLLIFPVLLLLSKARGEKGRKKIAYSYLSLGFFGLLLSLFYANLVLVPDIATGKIESTLHSSVLSNPDMVEGVMLLFTRVISDALRVNPAALASETVRFLDIYIGSEFLYIPVLLVAVSLVDLRKADESWRRVMVPAWLFATAFFIIGPVTALMLNTGYSPVRSYPMLILPVSLAAARGASILIERSNYAAVLPLLLVLLHLFHLPAVVGGGNLTPVSNLDFTGGWYSTSGGTLWVFNAASVNAESPVDSASFEARSFHRPRNMTVELDSKRFEFGVPTRWKFYNLSDGNLSKLTFRPHGGCQRPSQISNSGDSRCLGVGVRDIEMGGKSSDEQECPSSPFLCFDVNPVGFDSERDWRNASIYTAENSDSSGRFYVSFPAVFLYYSGIESSRVEDLRWNVDHYLTNLTASLKSDRTTWVVTDGSRSRWQLNSFETAYLREECSFREREKVWIFRCG